MLCVKNAGALQSPGKVLFKPRSEIPVAGWDESAFGNDLLAQDLSEKGFSNPIFNCT